jgi:hypothetical protein
MDKLFSKENWREWAFIGFALIAVGVISWKGW